MMNTSKLADIAEITSSIAILVTLVFLVFQMQQNTQALQAGSRQALLANSVQALSNNVSQPEISLSYVKPTLSETERARLSAHLFILTQRGQAAWQQYQAGEINEYIWLNTRGPIAGILSYAQPRKWWNYFQARSAFDPTFTEYFEKLLADVPVQTQLDDIRAFD